MTACARRVRPAGRVDREVPRVVRATSGRGGVDVPGDELDERGTRLGRALDLAGARERRRAQEAVDVAALLRAAHRSAAARRRRRRVLTGGLLGAVAVAVLVPAALTPTAGPPDAARRPPDVPSAQPQRPASTAAPRQTWSPLLRDEQVAELLPGLVPEGAPVVEPAGGSTVGGLCADDVVHTADPRVQGHRRTWREEVPPPAPAAVQRVEERVRIFDGDGSEQYFGVALDNVATCLSGPAPRWSLDDAGEYRAHDVLAGWRPVTAASDAVHTAVLMRQGVVTVELRMTVRGDVGHALDLTRTAARRALEQALSMEGG